MSAPDLLLQALVEFALWLHPTWEHNNADDREKAEAAVNAFLKERLKNGS